MKFESLQPLYGFGGLNEEVLLASNEPAEISNSKTVYSGTGKAVLSFGPRARMLFRMPLLTDGPLDAFKFMNDSDSSTFRFPSRAMEPQGFLISIGGGRQASANPKENIPPMVEWVPEIIPCRILGNEDEQVDCFVFHLLNGVEFFGGGGLIEKDEKGGTHALQHVHLKWRGWIIEIKSTHKTSDIIKALNAKGGFALTHVGLIKRTDDSEFSVREMQDVRSGLISFLSFAFGHLCYPNLCVGFREEVKVYEEWSDQVKTWSKIGTWFHGTSISCGQASVLEHLFPLFMDKWDDEDWKSAICEVVHWYTDSNDTSQLMMEPALILQQAAMERLAYEYIVCDKRLISAREFRKRRASDNFRQLFTSLEMPLSIPLVLTNLSALVKNENGWEDAPQALTSIRNSIVHPDHSHRSQYSGEFYYDAWRLSLELIELSVLGICGYCGKYQSRIYQT